MVKKEITIHCQVCGAPETAKLSAESDEFMELLEKDVPDNYVCLECLEDPRKLEEVKRVLNIPDFIYL